jgi:hypothetical protein
MDTGRAPAPEKRAESHRRSAPDTPRESFPIILYKYKKLHKNRPEKRLPILENDEKIFFLGITPTLGVLYELIR